MYKGKIQRKAIAVILVLCMAATNFLFGAGSTVYAITEKDEYNNTQEQTKAEPLTVTIEAKVGDEDLKDGAEVGEGQVVRYIYKMTNNKNEDITNIKFNARHLNANVFKNVAYQQIYTISPDINIDYAYEEETNQSSAEFKIEKLEAGKTIAITYQVRVRNGVDKTATDAVISADNIDTVEVSSKNPVKSEIIKLTLSNNISRTSTVFEGKVIPNVFNIENLTNETQKDIVVNFEIPKEFQFFSIREEGNTTQANYEVLQKTENYLSFKIKELQPKENKNMYISIKVVEGEIGKVQKIIKYSANKDSKTYYSNELKVDIENKADTQLTATLSASTNAGVKKGDKLVYTITVKNTGEIADEVTITDAVPDIAVIKKAYYVLNDKKIEIENITSNAISKSLHIEPGVEVKLYIETNIDENTTQKTSIKNIATIVGINLKQGISTNEVTNELKINSEDIDILKIVIGIIIAIIVITTVGIMVYRKNRKEENHE